MSTSKKDLVSYRVQRAFGTLDDAKLLIENKKWNSAINRLYYSVFYAASALILLEDQAAFTHNGVKTSFSEKFVKTGKMDLSEGKLYSQLFFLETKGRL
ncbi:HEPN domain-containing protein [Algoriphagus sp. H41]|uniref:HEPN domain-containing protein n=1 Tax=Algoriphagus oliviformis TaxID=2811231 RepID=A0ABS3BYE1_9BACT|nr:HEPN domain-containing protein [Algoriphagus oliviformis]